jgi:hypothetical protein
MELSAKDIERFWTFVDKRGPDDCWLWQGGGPNNRYGNFSMGPRESCKTLLAHRVSYALAYGETSKQVCHQCDVTRCVNPAHLFAGTQKDNRVDCKQKGRTARGEQHGRRVLSEKEVLRIIDLDNQRMSVPSIAQKLGRAETTVRHVVAGRTWSWLTGRLYVSP